MWRLLWIAGVVFVSDQLTKYFASDYLVRHGEVNLGPFLNLVLVHNTGAAFGFLSSASGWQNGLFMFVALVACAFLLWMLSRLNRQEMLLAVALMLILGGALGNLLDRVIFGYVIDFIDVHYHHWHWPAFNVADSAITVGAILLILDTVWLARGRRP
ncbi:MAG: signal peptidase II [Gammaproteobacteria bacterium]|nr:signal peptidase II [Gammaproteobacteria bacterium]MDH3407615.1 signal peptidase II [Gammaproteobacteria bacterium]MDH5487552.1 signal peptidase II [Gammaproteobacteria bacterium]